MIFSIFKIPNLHYVTAGRLFLSPLLPKTSSRQTGKKAKVSDPSIHFNKYDSLIGITTAGLLLLFGSGCVEHVITVRVHPDATYTMQFVSRGDSSDVFDNDFPHPRDDRLWATKTYREPGEEDKIWVMETVGMVTGTTIFSAPGSDPAPLRHPISVSKTEGWIATTYEVTQVFKGREVYRKYPSLGNAVLNESVSDSTVWLPETVRYICTRALEDIKTDTTLRLDPRFIERMINHLRNYFTHIRAENLTAELKTDRSFFLRRVFSPFKEQLTEAFFNRMLTLTDAYERELRTTINLNDDRFNFHLFLPGRLLNTNADTIAGDTLKWTFTLENFINDDYVITASSIVYSSKRIQKTVLLVVGGLLLILLFIRKWRQR